MTIYLTFFLLVLIGFYFYTTNKINKLENPSSNNHDVNNVRFNGYYCHRYDGLSYYGEKIKLTVILIFSEDNYVYYEDIMGHPKFNDQDIVDIINKMKSEKELSYNLGKYQLKNKEIKLLFFEPTEFGNEDILDPKIFKKFEGDMFNGNLKLKHSQQIFSREAQN